MKRLPCTVCGAESYDKKEGSKQYIICPYGHFKASSEEEWENAYANKMIKDLSEKLVKLEEEYETFLNNSKSVEKLRKERDEARLLVRRLLDPDWKPLGIEKTAYKAVLEWGKGVIS